MYTMTRLRAWFSRMVLGSVYTRRAAPVRFRPRVELEDRNAPGEVLFTALAGSAHDDPFRVDAGLDTPNWLSALAVRWQGSAPAASTPSPSDASVSTASDTPARRVLATDPVSAVFGGPLDKPWAAVFAPAPLRMTADLPAISISAPKPPAETAAATAPVVGGSPVLAAPASAFAPTTVAFGPRVGKPVSGTTTTTLSGGPASEVAQPLEITPTGDDLSVPAPSSGVGVKDRTDVTKLPKPDYYYTVAGEQIGLSVRSNQIAVGLSDATDTGLAAATKSGPLAGYTFVKWVTKDAALLEGPGAADFVGRSLPAGVTFAVPVFTNHSSGNYSVVTNEVTVALAAGVSETDFFDGQTRFSGHRPVAGTPDQFVATLTDGFGVAAVLAANDLSGDARLRWAEPNFHDEWQLFYDPNDPEYAAGNMWHEKNTGQNGGTTDADVDLDQAWDLNKGGSSKLLFAIVDDGIQVNHPDLNVWSNPAESGFDGIGDDKAFNGIDDDGNGYVDDAHGWNFVDNTAIVSPVPGDPNDQFSNHATAVSGVAAAKGDNGVGVVGASYKAQVLSSRIFKNNSTNLSNDQIAAAVYYAAGRNKAGTAQFVSVDVMNNSWGGGGLSNALIDSFTYATTSGRGGKGTITAVASGNGYASSISTPASLATTNPGIIAVGGSSDQDKRVSYSNYGTGLSLVAPTGEFGRQWIDTTDRAGADGYSATDYTGISEATGFGGTSSSTPLVTGIAGLVLSQAADKGVTLTAAQVRSYLMNTTDLISGKAVYNPATGLADEYGAGRANAFAAVAGIGKPEVDVTSASASIISGGTADFGTVLIGSAAPSVTQEFRVRNSGTSDLTLSGLTISGTAYSQESGLGATTLKVGEATTFAVTFTPTVAGTFTGKATFTTNDADEGTYTVNFTGVGVQKNISGRVFEDWNGNGTQDVNDPALAGRVVFLDTNKNGIQDGAVKASNNTPLVITDNGPGSPVYSDIVVTGGGASVLDVDVNLTITHTWDADVQAWLVAPNGKEVLLFDNVGGSGDNFTNTTLDDEASKAITAGSPPFTGSFRPMELLSGVDGISPNGTWRLKLDDTVSADEGTLQNWTITIASGEPSVVTDSTGDYTFLGLAAGDYRVAQVTPTGWTSTGPAAGYYDVNIANADTVVGGKDFGSAKNNRYYGNVYNDTNGNGSKDAGETPVTGRLVFEDVNGNGAFDGPATFGGTNSNQLVITDDGPDSPVYSDITVSGGSGTVLDADVNLTITHTWDADVQAWLVAPNGKEVLLFDNVGGSGDNFTNTTLDDEALVAIDDPGAVPPFTGSFRPMELLSGVDGLSPNGLWRLKLDDTVSADEGTLQNWSVTLTTKIAEPNNTTDALGNVFFDFSAGSHTVQVASKTGEAFTNPVTGKYTVTAAGAPLTNKYVGVGAADTTPPTVNSLTVNDSWGTDKAQRSRVTDLTVTFSEAVTFLGDVSGKDAFVLTRTPVGGGATSNITPVVAMSNGNKTATLTFAAGSPDYLSLPDGTYTIQVVGSKVQDAAGNKMTANFSGGGFHRLYGDGNGDGSTDGTDFLEYANTFQVSAPDPGFKGYYDFNADATVDGTDFLEFANRFGVTV